MVNDRFSQNHPIYHIDYQQTITQKWYQSEVYNK